MSNARRGPLASRNLAVILAALVVLVLASNVLWPGAPSQAPDAARMPPGESPFPFLRMGPELHVVALDPSANLSTRLLLASLQGLANRARVELYLDTDGEIGNASSMLAFLVSKYNVTFDVLTTDAAIARYMPNTTGLVVYDPSRPESVNVATMKAAQQGAALVGPDLAAPLRVRFNRSILFDYAGSDWASLDAIGATDRALRDLLPGSSETLLAILPPDRWSIRDYLVATRTFVFSLPQGALASPFETAATLRVLRATARGIPILGWFDSPTLTEENSFVQLASREGKFVVGVQDVPNLSVLTALGRNETRAQVAGPPPLVLENKTYAVLAVGDGDNVDFVAGRMRDLWTSPERGTVPIAWSMSPLLADLAPPLLDSYYDTMSPLDRFVAAPSGAGYLYPDYMGPGDLDPFLELSRRYMAVADMDVVWLLNAFAASEIPYADASLAAYIDAIRPDGIALDYDDQPRSRDAWMQAGSAAVAPVVRSTHFWTTRDNFLGKFEAARATWDEGPHFLWITVYTFRFDLRDATALVDEMQRRTGGEVVVVTPTQFFRLLREDFIARSAARVREASEDPVASFLFASYLRSAEGRLQDAEALLASGDLNRASYAAYLAMEDVRALSMIEALLAVSLVIGALAAVLLAMHAPRIRWSRRSAAHLRSFVFVVVGIAFFFLALREAAMQNFWTYPSIGIGVLAAGVSRSLRQHLDRVYPSRAPLAAAVFLLVANSLAIHTTAAFPLAIVATLVALDSILCREPLPPSQLVVAFCIGSAIGFASPFSLPVMTALAMLLVAAPSTMAARLPPEPTPERRPGRGFAGLLLVLPLGALAIPSSYVLSLQLDMQGAALTTVSTFLLILSGLAVWCLDRLLPIRDATRSAMAALGLAVVSCGAVLVTRGALAASLALLALFTTLAFGAVSSLRQYADRGGAARDVLGPAIVLVPLLFLFVRMPPVVYSLTLVPLPEPVEFALYTPVVLVAGAAIALGTYAWFRARRAPEVEKDYPTEANGGARGT
ncbi:MAG TPA: hypothetical protein VIL45_00170 [Thermoplasmata archaeon]